VEAQILRLLPDENGIWVYMNDGESKLKFLNFQWKFEEERTLKTDT
jgi:hypothetical protein